METINNGMTIVSSQLNGLKKTNPIHLCLFVLLCGASSRLRGGSLAVPWSPEGNPGAPTGQKGELYNRIAVE